MIKCHVGSYWNLLVRSAVPTVLAKQARGNLYPLLFYLETSARIQGNTTCTQQECQWIIPSYLKEVAYSPIKDIHFLSNPAKQSQPLIVIQRHSGLQARPQVGGEK